MSTTLKLCGFVLRRCSCSRRMLYSAEQIRLRLFSRKNAFFHFLFCKENNVFGDVFVVYSDLDVFVFWFEYGIVRPCPKFLSRCMVNYKSPRVCCLGIFRCRLCTKARSRFVEFFPGYLKWWSLNEMNEFEVEEAMGWDFLRFLGQVRFKCAKYSENCVKWDKILFKILKMCSKVVWNISGIARNWNKIY